MVDLKLILGRSNLALGEAIAKQLETAPTELLLTNFADGEIRVQILENIRGKDVFIIASTQPPSDNLLELLLLLDAAKRASARRVTAVIPYFGYARQERKDRPRVPISAKLIANLLAASGADRILTMELHSPAIQGFFDVPTDHLSSDLEFESFIRDHMSHIQGKDMVVVSPDIGGVKRIEHLAQHLGATIAIVYKRRDEPNKSAAMDLIGRVEGKVAILLDDIVDTAGTLVSAAKMLKDRGARSVVALATHPLLSPPAVERLIGSQIDLLAVTNTLPLREDAREKLVPKMLRVVSVASLFASAIRCIHEERSLSVLFRSEEHLKF